MKTDNWEKLPVTAFLLNLGSMVIFSIIYAHWRSIDKPLVFVMTSLLPVIVIGASFSLVSLYALRFTGFYFHRMASKGHTAMKGYALFEVAVQELILVVSLFVYISSVQMWI